MKEPLTRLIISCVFTFILMIVLGIVHHDYKLIVISLWLIPLLICLIASGIIFFHYLDTLPRVRGWREFAAKKGLYFNCRELKYLETSRSDFPFALEITGKYVNFDTKIYTRGHSTIIEMRFSSHHDIEFHISRKNSIRGTDFNNEFNLKCDQKNLVKINNIVTYEVRDKLLLYDGNFINIECSRSMLSCTLKDHILRHSSELSYICNIMSLLCQNIEKQKNSISCYGHGRDISEKEEMAMSSLLNNKYKIIKLLGSGNFGKVHLAERVSDHKEVVIKELLFSYNADIDEKIVRETFKREIAFLKTFNHPGLPEFYESFNHDGSGYFVVEYIKGETLEDKMNNSISINQALKWSIDIAEILDYLHNGFASPVVHKDLKPSNIIITGENKAKLIDFGTSRYYNPDKKSDTIRLGTPGYAAPEQCMAGTQSSPQSDVFSMGVILYQMLTKYDPTVDPFKFLPMKSLNPSIPVKLEDIVTRAIQLNPQKRTISAMEFKEQIEKYLGIEKSLSPSVAHFSHMDSVEKPSKLNFFSNIFFLKKESNVSVITPTEMTCIEGGIFLMGTNNNFLRPSMPHKVKVSSFYMATYPVTNREYQIYNRGHYNSGDDLPASVSWYDAVKYCNWLSKREGLTPCYRFYYKVDINKNGYRLPTEAEWEYACRAGSNTEYYWGNEMDGDYCWYEGNSNYIIHSVGKKKPNKFGLYDMSGNVWEWCGDWCEDDYYKYCADNNISDPPGPAKGLLRVLRGGSWDSLACYCRSGHRNNDGPDLGNVYGFRPVRRAYKRNR